MTQFVLHAADQGAGGSLRRCVTLAFNRCHVAELAVGIEGAGDGPAQGAFVWAFGFPYATAALPVRRTAESLRGDEAPTLRDYWTPAFVLESLSWLEGELANPGSSARRSVARSEESSGLSAGVVTAIMQSELFLLGALCKHAGHLGARVISMYEGRQEEERAAK